MLTREEINQFALAIGGGNSSNSMVCERAVFAGRLTHHCAVQGLELSNGEWIEVLQRTRELNHAALNGRPPRTRSARLVPLPSAQTSDTLHNNDEMLEYVDRQFLEILTMRSWDDDPIGGEIDRLVALLEELDPEFACGYINEWLMRVYAKINSGLPEPVGLFMLKISITPWLEPLPETRGRIQAGSAGCCL
jgi:hypothetical protein